MRRLAFAALAAIAGYVVGALTGYLAVSWFSSNAHDRSMEAAMTGAFVSGPLAAVVAFVATLILVRPRANAPDRRQPQPPP